jgi:hypothetical protein
MKFSWYLLAFTLFIHFLLSARVNADGIVVDKVYHPYVLPNEREFEWRFISHQKDSDNKGYNALAQRFAYGQSISESIMLEGYLVGERDEFGDFSLSAYEIEMRFMLTEQGQYWSDWGLLLEIEKAHKADNWEVTSGVLMEKEFGRTSLTLNAFIIYEWGESLSNEMEIEFRLKYRYRYTEQLQPAIELYSGEDYLGIGPAFMGVQRFNDQKQLKWEAAFITGLNRESKDHILRVGIEYEF